MVVRFGRSVALYGLIALFLDATGMQKQHE
jgi:hypothetical protein